MDKAAGSRFYLSSLWCVHSEYATYIFRATPDLLCNSLRQSRFFAVSVRTEKTRDSPVSSAGADSLVTVPAFPYSINPQSEILNLKFFHGLSPCC